MFERVRIRFDSAGEYATRSGCRMPGRSPCRRARAASAKRCCSTATRADKNSAFAPALPMHPDKARPASRRIPAGIAAVDVETELQVTPAERADPSVSNFCTGSERSHCAMKFIGGQRVVQPFQHDLDAAELHQQRRPYRRARPNIQHPRELDPRPRSIAREDGGAPARAAVRPWQRGARADARSFHAPCGARAGRALLDSRLHRGHHRSEACCTTTGTSDWCTRCCASIRRGSPRQRERVVEQAKARYAAPAEALCGGRHRQSDAA